MAGLPPKPTPTLDAIWRSYESRQDAGFREHLGASGIGAECSRAIWHSWRWTTRAKFSGRVLRLFQTGHMAEDRFASDLRSAGVQVMTVDPDTGKQWTCRDESGHFGGSADGVGIGFPEAEKTWHVCEFKTHSAKSFASLQKDGVEKSKPQHFAQMQIYMHLLGIERAAYLAVNKDNDDLYFERVRYDVEVALRLVAKAHRIIEAPNPPERISADPTWFQCKFCDHAATCHGGTLPEFHCRSCACSTPIDGGRWQCERDGRVLSLQDQRGGCVAHLYIPSLVAGEQVDADADGMWIEYQMPNGDVWRDVAVPF